MSPQVLSLPKLNTVSAPDRSDERRWEQYDQQRQWFVYALPLVMAILLALVPLLRKAAILPFALVLVPLVLWTALRDPERAVYVYCAWSWMDGTIRGLGGGGIVLGVARDIVLAVVLIGWAIHRSRGRDKDPIRKPPGNMIIGLFIFNCVMEMFNPYSAGLFRSLAGLSIHLVPIMLFFVAFDVFRRRDQVRSLLIFLVLATLVVSVVSIIQYKEGREWTNAHFPGTEKIISQTYNYSTDARYEKDANYKPPGTTDFGGGTAAFTSAALPLVFVMLLMSGRLRFTAPMRAFLRVILLVFIITFFVNGVRSALVLGVVGVLFCSFFVGGRLRVRAMLGASACLILGLIGWAISINLTHGGALDRFAGLFTDPNAAYLKERVPFYVQLPVILYHSSMGIGLGSTGAVVGYLGPHYGLGFTPFTEAYFGNMIFETGIIGALLISGIALFFIRRGYVAAQGVRSADDRLMAMVMLSSLVLTFVNFFFTPALVTLPYSVLFWLFAAVLLRVYGTGRPSATRPAPEWKAGSL